MSPINIPYQDLILLRKNQELTNIYDVEMRHLDVLRQYETIECHSVVYPYSRKVCANHLAFFPFEEYVKDILTQQKSAYVTIARNVHKGFGVALGLMILVLFLLYKPEDLLSVGSIVSIVGAYIMGKELWDDLERFLITLSKTWRIRYQEPYYAFQLEKHTTLTHYSSFAKQHRYGKPSLLAEKMDFIEQSNSQTVRLCFHHADLPASNENSGHIFSMHVDPSVLSDFEQEGFLFGVKLSLNRRRWGGLRQCTELFQSIHKGAYGALDDRGIWVENAVFYRKTLVYGRVKLFLTSGLMPQTKIIAQA
ncbi:hypothetical protein U27_04448 [Candidatus Vecturithrix granuli]|uniref:Uncharacterized protein n=1 Tax=Vecturithrix granuli TaxID=1499967 RepID=A0A081BYS6_VECG1|nr:hypothetical protein U27_04448 [Candidatus Vecturithrix granuli]